MSPFYFMDIITSDGKQYKMPIFYCFYCKMDTAGNHETWCLLSYQFNYIYSLREIMLDGDLIYPPYYPDYKTIFNSGIYRNK